MEILVTLGTLIKINHKLRWYSRFASNSCNKSEQNMPKNCKRTILCIQRSISHSHCLQLTSKHWRNYYKNNLRATKMKRYLLSSRKGVLVKKTSRIYTALPIKTWKKIINIVRLMNCKITFLSLWSNCRCPKTTSNYSNSMPLNLRDGNLYTMGWKHFLMKGFPLFLV